MLSYHDAEKLSFICWWWTQASYVTWVTVFIDITKPRLIKRFLYLCKKKPFPLILGPQRSVSNENGSNYWNSYPLRKKKRLQQFWLKCNECSSDTLRLSLVLRLFLLGLGKLNARRGFLANFGSGNWAVGRAKLWFQQTLCECRSVD